MVAADWSRNHWEINRKQKNNGSCLSSCVHGSALDPHDLCSRSSMRNSNPQTLGPYALSRHTGICEHYCLNLGHLNCIHCSILCIRSSSDSRLLLESFNICCLQESDSTTGRDRIQKQPQLIICDGGHKKNAMQQAVGTSNKGK